MQSAGRRETSGAADIRHMWNIARSSKQLVLSLLGGAGTKWQQLTLAATDPDFDDVPPLVTVEVVEAKVAMVPGLHRPTNRQKKIMPA
jgi:hypothetical protein